MAVDNSSLGDSVAELSRSLLAVTTRNFLAEQAIIVGH